VQAGMVGINIGVPAPMAFFPFSGWHASFFGDLHLQGRESVAFFTQQKVTTTRWFVKGIRLVGPLPEALQKYTVYVATPVPGTREPQLVAAYVQHLLGEQARRALAPLGYTRPE
jgi:hypothetical protein